MSYYTYKFRLYPTAKQEILLNKHFGCCRWLYNHFLNERNDFYLKNKDKPKREKRLLNYYDNARELTRLRNSEETKWLAEVGCNAQQQTLKDMDGAFGNFFKRKCKFPKFKKKSGKNSFRMPDPRTIKIKNNKICFAKFSEGVKFDNHRSVEGKICYVTISKTQSNQYFVSITVEKQHRKLKKNKRIIAADLGIKDLVVLSSGERFKNIKPYKTLQKRLRLLQKAMSRCTKGSKGREKCRRKLAKLHQKIANIRSNHLHQISHKIVNENQVIILEDLSVVSMRKRPLNKALMDVSLSELVRQIEYKAEWCGRIVIKVDRWYPSSKTCNECCYINQNLKLSDRNWECPNCHKILDRDLNAAKNLLQQGLRLIKEEKTARNAELADCPDVNLSSSNASLVGESSLLGRNIDLSVFEKIH